MKVTENLLKKKNQQYIFYSLEFLCYVIYNAFFILMTLHMDKSVTGTAVSLFS